MDAELRELCERLRGLLAENDDESGFYLHRQTIERLIDTIAAQGAELEGVREHCRQLTGDKFSDRNHAALKSRAERAEAELEGVRKDAELGRYIRLTADQRAQGLSEAAFSIRVENAIKRREIADTAIADSGAGGG